MVGLVFFVTLILVSFIYNQAAPGPAVCSTNYGEGSCLPTASCEMNGGFSIPTNCSGTDVSCCLRERPLLSYDPNAAVSYGNSHCATHSEWLCAEFVAHALHYAGEFPGLTDYGNYNGYNLKMVSGLKSALLKAGWTASSSGTWCGSAGQVLIYNINGDPNAHAALAIGNCLLDQHNPSRCGTASNWGTNIVLKR